MPTLPRILCGLLAVVSTAVTGCAPDHYVPLGPGPVAPPATFAHRAASPEVELLWNCSPPRPEVVRLEGAARNSGQREVRSVSLTVRSMQTGNPPLFLTAEALPEITLYRSGPSAFQIDLPLEKAASRIDVSAVYTVTPDVRAPDSVGPQVTLGVEDACGASMHLNPSYRR